MFRILCNNAFFNVVGVVICIIYVEATFICYFAECPNLKFRAIEYLDTRSCKTGTDFDVTVICLELTVVRDLPIKRPPETDGLGPEPREEAWRIRRRMYNSDSSDRLAGTHNFIINCVQVVTCTVFFMSESYA